ncbi:hypothetical protein LFML04_2521 [Leptospirillum ferriphilum ML-04]|uniref:Uncharacterized protein n=1 Tax=Leptospirillum ferriphilum (strain ML-04) TaxID=1048260 RepID=J9ZEB3_LEPFM|nr:hypothetical protein LFML04_2521 [Leptospirillum ferriphilum ML-04]
MVLEKMEYSVRVSPKIMIPCLKIECQSILILIDHENHFHNRNRMSGSQDAECPGR